jgi:hypothetical protein
MIGAADLSLFSYADDPLAALALLRRGIAAGPEETKAPDFAHSRTPPCD